MGSLNPPTPPASPPFLLCLILVETCLRHQCYRMMSDMGKVLDWCTDIVMEKRWKVMKLALGPGKNILVGMHPDVLKTMAKSGT